MTRDVLPLQRTAAAVVAAHASAVDEARERRRRLAWVFGAVLALIAVFELITYPRTSAVRVTPKRTVDVVRVARLADVDRFFRRPVAKLGPALVVQYFSTESGDQAQGLERLDVFEWARPIAEREGIRVVVVWGMEPMLTRLLPLTHSRIYPYRERPDGSWGGL